MKITKVRAHVLRSALPQPFAFSQGWVSSRGATLVEVETDEGIVGWGEALCQGLQPPEIAGRPHEAAFDGARAHQLEALLRAPGAARSGRLGHCAPPHPLAKHAQQPEAAALRQGEDLDRPPQRHGLHQHRLAVGGDDELIGPGQEAEIRVLAGIVGPARSISGSAAT